MMAIITVEQHCIGSLIRSGTGSGGCVVGAAQRVQCAPTDCLAI